MPQFTGGRPFKEFDFRDQFRPNPVRPATAEPREVPDARLCFFDTAKFR
jgi:hypothetical protein